MAIDWDKIVTEVDGIDLFVERYKLGGTYTKVPAESLVALQRRKQLLADAEDLLKKAQLLKEQADAVYSCEKHGHVVHDMPGFPYDTRQCVMCNKYWTI